jgi:2-iminobutanoate/2-iminopropanoate deaminase
MKQAAARRVIPGAQASSGAPYSGAVIANGFVFVSGQTFPGPDIEAQTKGALDKIAGLLREAGTDMSQAVRLTVFIADITLRDRMNAVYAGYFPKEPPARATVECKLARPDLMVEIDCVAVLSAD